MLNTPATPITSSDPLYLSIEEYKSRVAHMDGVCLHCRAWQGGVEPDNAGIECAHCGLPEVCGLEDAMIAGVVIFRGAADANAADAATETDEVES